MDKVAKRIVFSGSVQGVGFRFTAQSVARRYDLAGYVKNTPDGKVEMLAQGHPEDVRDCIADLQETFAIRDVQIVEQPVSPAYNNFDIAF